MPTSERRQAGAQQVLLRRVVGFQFRRLGEPQQGGGDVAGVGNARAIGDVELDEAASGLVALLGGDLLLFDGDLLLPPCFIALLTGDHAEDAGGDREGRQPDDRGRRDTTGAPMLPDIFADELVEGLALQWM